MAQAERTSIRFPPVSWILSNILELFWSMSLFFLIQACVPALLDTAVGEHLPAALNFRLLSILAHLFLRIWLVSAILVFYSELAYHWIWDVALLLQPVRFSNYCLFGLLCFNYCLLALFYPWLSMKDSSDNGRLSFLLYPG
jgi:hypothetical protein